MEYFLLAAGLVVQGVADMDRRPAMPVVRHTVVSKSEQESQALAYMQHKREFALLQIAQKFPNYEDRKPYMAELDLQERKALQNLALVYGQSQLDRHVGAEQVILAHAKKMRELENERHHQQLKEDVIRSLFGSPQKATAAPASRA